MKRQASIRIVLLVCAVAVLAWAVIPRTIVIVPQWEVRVVDSVERPYPDVEVAEHWAHYLVSLVSQLEERRTNSKGIVVFEERIVVLSGLGQIRGALRAISRVGINASFGSDSSISVAEPASGGMTVAVLRERAAWRNGGLVSKVKLLGTVEEYPAIPVSQDGTPSRGRGL